MPAACFDVTGIDYPDFVYGGETPWSNNVYIPGIIFGRVFQGTGLGVMGPRHLRCHISHAYLCRTVCVNSDHDHVGLPGRCVGCHHCQVVLVRDRHVPLRAGTSRLLKTCQSMDLDHCFAFLHRKACGNKRGAEEGRTLLSSTAGTGAVLPRGFVPRGCCPQGW